MTPPSYSCSTSTFQEFFNTDYLEQYLKFPDRRLWIAVVSRALNDLDSYYEHAASKDLTKEHYYNAKDARCWLRSDSTERLSYLWAINHIFPSNMTAVVLERIEVISRPDIPPFLPIFSSYCSCSDS